MPPDPSPEAVEIRLRDLRPGPPVSFVARLVKIERKEITRKSDGQRRTILSGLLSDGTGTARFTWWEPPAEEIERGTVLRVARAEVREYGGRAELSFSYKTRIAPAAEGELPSLGWEEMPVRSIRDLVPPEEGFRIDARILRVRSRGVPVGTEQRTVFEGLLGDATGTLGFSAWRDFSLQEGEAVRIGGGYLRRFRGRTQIVLDDRSIVIRIADGSVPPVETLVRPTRQRLDRIEQEGGGEMVEFTGRVVGLLPPSGVQYRCPQCQRATHQGLCATHGAVPGVADLSVRLVVDDGTGSATVNLDRSMTEQTSGLTLDDCLTRLRATPDPSIIEELLFERFLGTRWTIEGRAYVDDFGLSVQTDQIQPEHDPIERVVEEIVRRVR